MKKVNAIITNKHLVYTSGKHGSVYINKDALYPHTKETSKVGKMIAQKFVGKNIEVVVGPAIGGIILSQWTAFHLSKLEKREILSIYCEKDKNENQVFTRNYDTLVKNKRVLIVEDIIMTGGSIQKAIKTVKEFKGKIIGACAMVNRAPRQVNSKTLGVPFEYLGIIEAGAYDAKDCPLCKKNVPIYTKVGHGKKYLENLKNK